METGKPLISILMAVYEPRMDWLKEQLDSLNAQTYPNLRLYILDDCSPTVPFDEIEALARECITAFPFSIERNKENLGSNGTFERLTREAEGEYFAYCDQDDVWLPEKLTVLQEAMVRESAQLVCSDMYIIDGDGNTTANSITKIRRHHVFRSGTGLAEKLLVSNWVTGCTMVIRAATAKEAVPFCPYMVHDQHLALWSAQKGVILSVDAPLIRYRVHTGNQTLAMAGVVDKESYYQIRIKTIRNRAEWLEARFRDNIIFHEVINRMLQWTIARDHHFKGQKGCARMMIKYWRFSPFTTLFELVASNWPDRIFMYFVELKRNNTV